MKCPFCGYEASESKFEALRGPWRFNFYTVKRLKCPKCGGVFNYYSGESPKTGKHTEFTIRIRLPGKTT